MEVAKQVIGPSMNNGNVERKTYVTSLDILERHLEADIQHIEAPISSGCLTPSSPERVKEATKALQVHCIVALKPFETLYVVLASTYSIRILARPTSIKSTLPVWQQPS